ncbi:MAG: hypothetical protein FJX78_06030 [Armatimonadetes bacterium]|nr:hypothetical protein [Armatimonadota bacterium]
MSRALAFVLFVSLLLVGPATAATVSAGVGYDLTFTGTNTAGTISGTIGGVPDQGPYSGGTWTVTAEGKPFAAGTCACGGTCAITGTTVAGRSVSFPLSGTTLTGTKSGVLPASTFPNHGALVSSVAQWANKNLERGDRGKVVRDGFVRA